MRENVLPMGNSPGGAIRPIGLYRIRHLLLRKHQLSGKFTACGSNRGLLRSLRSLKLRLERCRLPSVLRARHRRRLLRLVGSCSARRVA